MANFRCRPLLDLAYEVPCQIGPVLREHGITVLCSGAEGEPCHSNFAEHGKGKSIKAHDCFFAAGCRACHTWLDTGKAARELKREVFRQAMERTFLEFWRRDLIVVYLAQAFMQREARKRAERSEELPRILPRRY